MFRYGIIAEFVGATRLERGERETLLREKCARKWQIPFSSRTRLSRSTTPRDGHPCRPCTPSPQLTTTVN